MIAKSQKDCKSGNAYFTTNYSFDLGFALLPIFLQSDLFRYRGHNSMEKEENSEYMIELK